MTPCLRQLRTTEKAAGSQSTWITDPPSEVARWGHSPDMVFCIMSLAQHSRQGERGGWDWAVTILARRESGSEVSVERRLEKEVPPTFKVTQAISSVWILEHISSRTPTQILAQDWIGQKSPGLDFNKSAWTSVATKIDIIMRKSVVNMSNWKWKLSIDESYNSRKKRWLVTFRLWRCFIYKNAFCCVLSDVYRFGKKVFTTSIWKDVFFRAHSL